MTSRSPSRLPRLALARRTSSLTSSSRPKKTSASRTSIAARPGKGERSGGHGVLISALAAASLQRLS